MAKRTVENCSIIKKAVRKGEGDPWVRNGKCPGYSHTEGDEPIEECLKCKLNEHYGEE